MKKILMKRIECMQTRSISCNEMIDTPMLLVVLHSDDVLKLTWYNCR